MWGPTQHGPTVSFPGPGPRAECPGPGVPTAAAWGQRCQCPRFTDANPKAQSGEGTCPGGLSSGVLEAELEARLFLAPESVLLATALQHSRRALRTWSWAPAPGFLRQWLSNLNYFSEAPGKP